MIFLVTFWKWGCEYMFILQRKRYINSPKRSHVLEGVLLSTTMSTFPTLFVESQLFHLPTKINRLKACHLVSKIGGASFSAQHKCICIRKHTPIKFLLAAVLPWCVLSQTFPSPALPEKRTGRLEPEMQAGRSGSEGAGLPLAAAGMRGGREGAVRGTAAMRRQPGAPRL